MTNRNDLRGQTAIVTGAGRGIGKAIAVGFAQIGAKVVCAGRDPETLAQTVDQISEEGGTAELLIVADQQSRRWLMLALHLELCAGPRAANLPQQPMCSRLRPS